VRTFLLFLNTEQKIETVEHGMVRGLAIANVATCESRALAKEYMDIFWPQPLANQKIKTAKPSKLFRVSSPHVAAVLSLQLVSA